MNVALEVGSQVGCVHNAPSPFCQLPQGIISLTYFVIGWALPWIQIMRPAVVDFKTRLEQFVPAHGSEIFVFLEPPKRKTLSRAV